VALFNGSIPLIAIQMQALKVGEHTTLIFTKVMDELSRGLVDEDEDAEAAPTDRAYWEKKGTKATVQLADELLGIAHEIDPFNRVLAGTKLRKIKRLAVLPQADVVFVVSQVQGANRAFRLLVGFALCHEEQDRQALECLDRSRLVPEPSAH
jgi:hypothetical protein